MATTRPVPILLVDGSSLKKESLKTPEEGTGGAFSRSRATIKAIMKKKNPNSQKRPKLRPFFWAIKAGINPSREAKIATPIQVYVVTGSSLLRMDSVEENTSYSACV
jgi:hypothetical protein